MDGLKGRGERVSTCESNRWSKSNDVYCEDTYVEGKPGTTPKGILYMVLS